MNRIVPPHVSQSASRISERGPSSKKQERSLLRGAIGHASLSASGTSPQEGRGDEKGTVKGRRGLGRPPTSEDGNESSSGFIFLNQESALELG
ncbi:hypothetical protein F2Q69_00007546 [Brassica cretica]|uniref:Uncharacterized protein n=1 Tax=Brassica cretica TaxID=69181 RepID=A0A8S9NPT5_BRACR|nr:hypothetical protein F2Q69_00007546 [Brassica cretica]